MASSFAASCQDACKDGLTYCNGGCYDFENDSESCSACLNYCSLGESCAHAACAVWQTDAGDTADAGMSSAAVCAACVRPQLFESSGSCAAVYQDCKADEACTAWTHCVATCFASRFAPGCIGACNDGANDGGSSDRVAAVLGCACAIVGVLTNDAGSLVTGTNPSCREPCAALCP